MKAWKRRRAARQQTLLDTTRFVLLRLEVFDAAAVTLYTLCIIHGDRDMTGQCLEDFDLGAVEGINIMVRSAECPDNAVVHLEWNDDFRADVGLARTVKQFLAHIGRVVCLARRNNLRAQAFIYRPALARFRLAATVHRREVE